MTELLTYDEIRADLLVYYWNGCLDNVPARSTSEEVLAWAMDQLDGAYEHPLERLMSDTVALALALPWSDRLATYCRSRCLDSIANMGGVIRFDLLSENDADIFEKVLRKLRIIA